MTQHTGRKPFRADKSVSEGCWEKKFLWARNHSPQQLLARGGALGEGLGSSDSAQAGAHLMC